jgi:outer membrane protein OmpA-like peptidoglycan-associated protein
MSDTGPKAGFQTIAQVVLRDKTDNQTFPVQAEIPGRWLRLTVLSNHGSPDYTEIMDFRATGRQLTHTPVANISGTYDTDYSKFHVRQEGTSLTGCYEYNEGILTGGIEGRVLNFTWIEGENKGPAIMVISPDGQELLGLWWHNEAKGPPAGVWNGKKVSNEVGGCPHWAGGAAEQLTRDLTEFGRARVYGINFDTDSAVIRDESKPTLDKIAAVLKANPGWKMTIEGHTDGTGTAAHNQTLSEQRARAVLAYLTAAGIAADRLQSVGFGATKPVAANDTGLGRAQNRRVELVRR